MAVVATAVVVLGHEFLTGTHARALVEAGLVFLFGGWRGGSQLSREKGGDCLRSSGCVEGLLCDGQLHSTPPAIDPPQHP